LNPKSKAVREVLEKSGVELSVTCHLAQAASKRGLGAVQEPTKRLSERLRRDALKVMLAGVAR
jgi:hypothetical protein